VLPISSRMDSAYSIGREYRLPFLAILDLEGSLPEGVSAISATSR
jgi:hypothetical protein